VICWSEGTKLEIGGCLGRVSQLPHTCRVIHLIRCYRTARSIEELFVRLMLSRLSSWHEVEKLGIGGEAGIRTLGTGLSPYNGLANRRLQPLGHLTARLASIRDIATYAEMIRDDRAEASSAQTVAFATKCNHAGCLHRPSALRVGHNRWGTLPGTVGVLYSVRSRREGKR
jgi:hypothetical protein